MKIMLGFSPGHGYWVSFPLIIEMRFGPLKAWLLCGGILSWNAQSKGAAHTALKMIARNTCGSGVDRFPLRSVHGLAPRLVIMSSSSES